MVAVAAAHHAAHVDVRYSRLTVAALSLAADVGHARQELDVVVEVRDVELLELLRPERHDRERHVLQVLAALLRGNDDLLESTRLPALLRMDYRHGRESGGDRRGDR